MTDRLPPPGPRRREVLALSCALAAPGLARAEVAQPQIAVTTGLGPMTFVLALGQAPVTAGNFLKYVKGRRFDGTRFYRAVRTPGAPETGLVQGGAENALKRVLPPIAHESTTQTGLRHVDGTLSMARGAPGTATGDFFICVGPAPFLDAGPDSGGDQLGYAAFGQVTVGMDLVRAILAMPTDGYARNPGMKGQILTSPVPILTMRLA
jgi:peptidyl-prolyl cis-trans isomerase A (cyclophilin A)